MLLSPKWPTIHVSLCAYINSTKEVIIFELIIITTRVIKYLLKPSLTVMKNSCFFWQSESWKSVITNALDRSQGVEGQSILLNTPCTKLRKPGESELNLTWKPSSWEPGSIVAEVTTQASKEGKQPTVLWHLWTTSTTTWNDKAKGVMVCLGN